MERNKENGRFEGENGAWTKEEIQFLKDNSSSLSIDEISYKLGRTFAATKLKISRLGLTSNNPKKRWSKEEETFIIDNHKDMTCEEMAKRLGRTTKSVQHVFGALGLSRDNTVAIGDKFSRLTVISSPFQKEHYGSNKTFVKCKCGCKEQTEVEATISQLYRGDKTSCGCAYVNRKTGEIVEYHNLTSHPIGKIYWGMISRTRYEYEEPTAYNIKGINVCDEWSAPKTGIIAFHEWSINNNWKEGLTIDRIDNDGDYCPENCRWTTSKVQNNNKDNNWFITAFGETKTLGQWIEDDRTIKDYYVIADRLRKLKWSPEDALTKPIRYMDKEKSSKYIDVN